MTQKDFMQGWALLVAQPYGAAYRKEIDVEQTQRRYWQEQFGQATREAWIQSVTWWIAQQDHFPLVPEMRSTLLRFRPPVEPAPTDQQLTDGVSVPVDQQDLLAYAVAHHVTVFDAVKRWRDVEAWKRNGITTSQARQDSRQELR